MHVPKILLEDPPDSVGIWSCLWNSVTIRMYMWTPVGVDL